MFNGNEKIHHKRPLMCEIIETINFACMFLVGEILKRFQNGVQSNKNIRIIRFFRNLNNL